MPRKSTGPSSLRLAKRLLQMYLQTYDNNIGIDRVRQFEDTAVALANAVLKEQKPPHAKGGKDA